jgi:hypothetical protein
MVVQWDLLLAAYSVYYLVAQKALQRAVHLVAWKVALKDKP